MFEGKITVSDKEIPRALLGTSPFIAAPQFGHRARLYQLDLYNNPENIFKIIISSWEMGVTGIQVIPYPPVIEAVEMAVEAGFKMQVVGTLRPDNETEDIETLSLLNTDAMLLHGSTTDKGDWAHIEKYLQAVKDEGAIPGLATHMPFSCTEKLLESPVLDLFQLYMVPVNKLGYLMDCDTFGPEKRNELSDKIISLKKIVIAKKVLAAGILTPEEGLDHLETVNFADIVTFGIASEDESRQTFGYLFKK